MTWLPRAVLTPQRLMCVLAVGVALAGCRSDTPSSQLPRADLSALEEGTATPVAAASTDADTPEAPAPTLDPRAPTDATPAEPSILERALRDDGRFHCVSEADCVNSCELGAVNAAWYATLEPLGFIECEDGCADVAAAPPRCEGGRCVAYMEDRRGEDAPARRDACTERAPPP